MEAREPVSLNAIRSTGAGLQVRFAWREDRHAHTVSLIVADRFTALLESVEGSSVDAWPPSPPLQQLSVEELRPRTQVALLVGMAGKGHWSMSVEPVGDRAAFAFDVACRSQDPVERVGSTYRLVAGKVTRDNEHSATVDVAGSSFGIICDHAGSTAATLELAPHGLHITPATIASRGTTRWRYILEIR